jgi:sialidase-1
MKPYTVLILTILTVACQINAPFNVMGNTSALKRKILDAQADPYNQQETTVFKSGDEGFSCYRIPAIIKAPNGDLLAFCEARKRSCSDHGDVSIVLKRSSDNGTTWSKQEEVATFGNNQSGNPAPVVDMMDKKHPKGRIFLFYNTGTASEQEVREGRAIREIWYKTSVDNGKTWSKPVNITTSVSKPQMPGLNPAYHFREDWRSYANTPGHALQLTKGTYKGRIFIAANHSEGSPQQQFKDYLAHGFYSDNHGKTWAITPAVNYPGSNESTAAELSNGGILMNIRNQSGDSRHRILAFSATAGAKWDTFYIEKQLPDPVCEGSMLNYTTKTGEKVLLFSNINHATKRENLTLYVSTDNGKTWRNGKTICKGNAAYSDLVTQQDGTIGILYEKDDYTKIVYERVDYEDLFADEKSRGDTQSPRDDQSWKGFERVAFKIGKHDAYYVKPTKALEGKPWVWRASFPDWHTDMDSILLTKGFHVVFVQVDDEYGSPYAMQIWDKTYNYLTDSCSFAPKVALEGVSRGGLYVYGWAKRNPDKVSCIYNEAPVCDIKSWPGGKGKSAGNKDNWAQLLQVFKMTEAEALAFNDNPIDNLAGLAAFKVPILHVISNSDKIVPNEENTYLLVQRYTALGGPATIYPVTDGPQTLEGHHFPIRKADEWADFILKNTYPVKKP